MLYAVVAVIALIFDQLLKYWTTVSLVENTGRRNLIPGVIHLTNVRNTGAAFSFLQGARWFFVALCVVFVIVVVYMLVREIINTPRARWCAVIVMAGAIGNCIDRILNGYVVDMLEFDFTIFGKNFPVFNLADIYITVGVILFCIFLLTEKPKTEKDAVPAEAQSGKAPAEKPKPVARILPAETPGKPAAASEAGQTPVPQPQTPPRLVEKKAEKSAAAPENIPAQAVPVPKKTEGAAVPAPPQEAPVPEKSHARSRSALAAERIEGMGQKSDSAKTEQVMRVLVNGNPAPAERAPAPTAAPVSKPPAPEPEAEVSYDLDDILAEFRDL